MTQMYPPQTQQGFSPQQGQPQYTPQAPQLPPWVAQAQQSIQSGQFPWVNHVQMVGQVAPSKSLPNGFAWQAGQQGKNGSLNINVKLRNSYVQNGQQKVKTVNVRVVIWGQKGQQISGQIGVGAMVAFQGEYKLNAFNNKQNGGLVTQPQVVIDGRDQYGFLVIGGMPYVNEQQQFGGQQGFGQPQGQMPMQGQPTAPQGQWAQPQGQPVQPQPQQGQPQWGGQAPPQQGYGQQPAAPQQQWVPPQNQQPQGQMPPQYGQPQWQAPQQQYVAPQGQPMQPQPGYGHAPQAAPQQQFAQQPVGQPQFAQPGNQPSPPQMSGVPLNEADIPF